MGSPAILGDKMYAPGQQIKFAVFGTQVVDFKSAAVNYTASATADVIAAVAGKRIVLLGFMLRAAAATTLTFTDGTNTTGALGVPSTGFSAWPFSNTPILTSQVGAALRMTCSQNVVGQLLYCEVT